MPQSIKLPVLFLKISLLMYNLKVKVTFSFEIILISSEYRQNDFVCSQPRCLPFFSMFSKYNTVSKVAEKVEHGISDSKVPGYRLSIWAHSSLCPWVIIRHFPFIASLHTGVKWVPGWTVIESQCTIVSFLHSRAVCSLVEMASA